MNPARIRLPGHPDAACDMVAEAIVDEYMRRDPDTRIALSVIGGRGALFVAGDVISAADFDVAQIIQRTLGTIGIGTELEPFVSLEPVVGERATLFRNGAEAPVVVIGYATRETEEMIPTSLVLAKTIVKELDLRRRTDEVWFWLGADGEVHVGERISIRVEHSAKPIEDVRREISALVEKIAPRHDVRVNELGSDEVRGIGNVMGASGRDIHPYGSALPSTPSSIGLDISRAEKAGAWLARAAARNLVTRGAQAALVRVTYLPGERMPAHLEARDEKGRDLSRELARESLALDRVTHEWRCSNLCADASRWGFAGELDLPWEEG